MNFVALAAALALNQLPPNHPPIDAPAAATPPNHPPIGQGATAPSADDLIRKLEGAGDLKTREKPFEIAATLGRLYLGQGRYPEAATYYTQAVEKAEPPARFTKRSSRPSARPRLPTAAEAGCLATSESTLSSLFDAAQEKAKAKNVPAAVACARAALHPVIEAETTLGHARFLAGDAPGALKAYDSALALFDSNLDARYARAALLLDTQGDDAAALKRAKADFEAVIATSKDSSKGKQAQRLLARATEAIAAGGLSKLSTQKPTPVAEAPRMPALAPETMAAFQNAPRGPEQEAGWAKSLDAAEDSLAHAQYQAALDSYKQVMPFQPENPRVRAGMAWSLVKLNKPMAPTVWGVAMQNPEAFEVLAKTLEGKGDAEGAKALRERVKAGQ